MKLSTRQWQYLLIAQGVVPVVINFLINAAIVWLMFRGVDPVPTWGMQSTAGPDLIGTCFFLPAITSLIVTALVRRHVRSGMVEALSGPKLLPSWLLPFRASSGKRAGLFGLAGLVVFGGLTSLGLLAFAPPQFEFTTFLWLKAAYAGVLGGIVTPFIGWVALADGAGPA